jgi:UDP-N-acetylmuramate dehydrogenase
MTGFNQLTALADLTTIGVGGPAQRMLVATTRDELISFARELSMDAQPWCVLGGGSNSVFSDEGFDGTVLLTRTEGIEEVEPSNAGAGSGAGSGADSGAGSRAGSVLLRVQAGHDWDALVAYTVERGYAGIESLSGIPGTAGAAPIQNIGAYGQEVGSVLRSIEFVDAETGDLEEISASELELGYRSSALKRGRRGVVVSILIELTPRSESLLEERERVIALRTAKGMVFDPADADTHSCGSFFVNPIVRAEFARSLPSSAPRWPVASNDGVDMVKLSAAWLIEYAGVAKGFALPGSDAAISSKHSLAITNRGHATAQQVAELARFVVQRVQQDTGVILHPEPVIYGEAL